MCIEDRGLAPDVMLDLLDHLLLPRLIEPRVMFRRMPTWAAAWASVRSSRTPTPLNAAR